MKKNLFKKGWQSLDKALSFIDLQKWANRMPWILPLAVVCFIIGILTGPLWIIFIQEFIINFRR